MSPRFPTFAVTAAATLALAAPAHAADGIGSDLQQTHTPGTVKCTAYPCTLAQESFQDYTRAYLPGGSVITAWKARLAPGSSARLRVLRENFGDHTSVATSATGAAGAAGVQTFATRIPVGWGSQVIGMDLQSGSVVSDYHAADDGTRTVFWQPLLGGFETRAAAGTVNHELMLQAVVEDDADGDGYGDETQDGCVFCGTQGGGDTGAGGGGATGGGASGGGSLAGPGPAREPGGVPSNSKFKGPNLTIEPKAILRAGPGGKQGYVGVYASNEGDENTTGSVAVKRGRKTLWKQDADIDWGDNYSWGNLKLGRKDLKTLLRRGRLGGLTSVATFKDAKGRTVTRSSKFAIVRGGAIGYDGYYKGPGPVVIRVERGVLTTINTNLNLFCSRTKKFQQRSFLGDDGFPVLIGRDGSFSRKGSFAGDVVNYRGKLKKGGTGSGYLSLFHTNLGTSDGKLTAEQCFQAKNWKVARR